MSDELTIRSRYVTAEQLRAIIVEGDVATLVTVAEGFGDGLATRERLTTAQVRNIFGTVRQIQAEAAAAALADGSRDLLPPAAARRLMLLIPRMAYQARREEDARKGQGVQHLADVLGPAIRLVGQDADRFSRLVEFFEATLAYHKAKGGSDK